MNISAARVRNDLTIYENYAREWWDPNSYYFRSLQNITPFRLGLLKKWFGDLAGKDVIDFGCGGGLIAVPLMQLGARVVGIDLSPASALEARIQAQDRGAFLCADLQALPLKPHSADFAVLADVIDHIPGYPAVLADVAKTLRPGGKLFVSTINRTMRSWFLAIFLGEGLGLVPRGTHDHKLFVRPDELCGAAAKAGLNCQAIAGDAVDFVETARHWAVSMRLGSSLAVSYSAIFEKN